MAFEKSIGSDRRFTSAGWMMPRAAIVFRDAVIRRALTVYRAWTAQPAIVGFATMVWVAVAVGLEGGLAAQELRAIDSGSVQWRDTRLAVRDILAEKRILVGKTTHLARLEISAVTLASGATSREEAVHQTMEELILIKSGPLRVTVGEQTRELGNGSIALIMPGDSHRIENAGSTEAVYYCLRYQGKGEPDLARGKRGGGSLLVDFQELKFEPHNLGGRRDYFDRATAMCDNFEMHVTTLNAGLQSHPPHTHRAEEIILMIDGKAEEYISATTHPLQVGDFVFLASEIPHAIRNTGDAACTYFAFQWR